MNAFFSCHLYSFPHVPTTTTIAWLGSATTSKSLQPLLTSITVNQIVNNILDANDFCDIAIE